ncbi:hypothetical protein TNCV_2798441 [Trichonephila clavipes]|nr:hypothetical protein TNCV_2798441 [Trichonephila clavipes]
MPIQRDKPSNFDEKTENIPTNETSSHLGEKTEDMYHSTRQALSSGCEDDTIACSLLKCCRYRANRYDFTMVHSEMSKALSAHHHRAGGQAGCGHSSPGNEAIFPD